MPETRTTTPTADEAAAELKRLTGLDGYGVTLNDGKVDAYSYAIAGRGSYGAAAAALYWRDGRYELADRRPRNAAPASSWSH